MGFFLWSNWGMWEEITIHLPKTVSSTHLINGPSKKNMNLKLQVKLIKLGLEKTMSCTLRHVAASSQSQLGMREASFPWSNMKWRRIAIAPTGHLSGLRCGKTKLYFGSVFCNNKNIKMWVEVGKWLTPGWAVLVSWNNPITPNTSRVKGDIWPLWAVWCGRRTQNGWMHAISNDTTSSLRFSVEHCHVHAKWALTIDGTIPLS